MVERKISPIINKSLVNMIADAMKNPQVNGQFMYKSKEYNVLLITKDENEASALATTLKVFSHFYIATIKKKGMWVVGISGRKRECR
jgi:hypothetical protein